MNPTAVAMDNGMPVNQSDSMPPLNANGIPVKTSKPSLALLNTMNSRTNTMRRQFVAVHVDGENRQAAGLFNLDLSQRPAFLQSRRDLFCSIAEHRRVVAE